MLRGLENKDIILPSEALFDLLMLILREALKISKDRDMDQYLVKESLTVCYL